jgi:hypothetical protein
MYYIHKTLDIRYVDKDQNHKNKQINITKRPIYSNNPNDIIKLKQHLESEIFVIYDNKHYLEPHYSDKYKQIIDSYIDQDSTLIYATKYKYITF